MPVIPTLRRRLGQEDCQEFMVSFDYRMNSCLKKRRRGADVAGGTKGVGAGGKLCVWPGFCRKLVDPM